MGKVYLGIDQGSSSTKACLLDSENRLIAEFSKGVDSFRPAPDMVEQDPAELLTSVREVFASATSAAAKMKKSIASAGLACQRSGVCAWSIVTGASNGPLITWADRRFQATIDALSSKHEKVHEKTCMPILPNYAAPKISRLQKLFHSDRVHVGTLDSFIFSNLSNLKLFITDDTMAARTMLYALKSGKWDQELCEIFGVDISKLPEVRPSLGDYFSYENVPFTALIADQQAALFAAVCSGERALLNLGTIASLTLYTGSTYRNELGCVTSVLYSASDGENRRREFILESVTNACKAVLDFAAKEYGITELSEFDEICREATDTGHCTAFFPLGGTASPEWLTDLPCVFDSRLAGRAERVRALVENIANFLVFSFERIRVGEVINAEGLLVSGGASKLDYLLQYLADVTGFEFRRASLKETTARGAALAAKVSAENLKLGAVSTRDPGSATFVREKNAAREKYEKWVALKNRVIAGDLVGLEVFKSI